MSRLDVAQASERRARRPAPQETDSREDPDFVAAAARSLAVLEAFSPELPLLGNGEIAERSGLAKSTVSRLTYTLARLGYLVLDAGSQRYRLGPSVVQLLRSFAGARGLRTLARPHMEALALRFRAPVALTERDGLEMVYLEYCRGDAPVIVPRSIGSRVSLARSAAGRAWLASALEPEAQAVVRLLRGAVGRDWAAVRARLEAAREDLAARGFTRSYGELQPEVNSVAVPLHSPIDGSLMVFNLAAPSMLVPARRFDAELGPALVAMAAAVRQTVEAPAAGAAA